MFTNTIDNKPIFKRPDGIELKDLTQSIFSYDKKKYIKYDVYRVPREYRMRPDLIAKAVYNNTDYTEIILKFNGISNPFSMDEGDIILIPDLDSAISTLKDTVEGTSYDKDAELRKSYKYIDPLKIPKKSDNLSKFINRQIVNTNDGALPPNIAEEGVSQITYRDGRVYFGEGVETCLKNGISAGEFLTSVIKNKNKA